MIFWLAMIVTGIVVGYAGGSWVTQPDVDPMAAWDAED